VELLITPKLELDEAAPDYLEWLLKTKGLEIEKLKKSVDKIESYNESMDMIKIQELEQTKELLVHLTNKLFKKIESLEEREETENQKIEAEEKVQSDSLEKREECKIEFTDLTWYKERLNGKKP
jgi:hypothetical protein